MRLRFGNVTVWAAVMGLIPMFGQSLPPADLISHIRAAPAAAPASSASLRVDASLVQIPVQVTSEMGRSIDRLRKEDFRIFEDNVEQRITTFSRDDAPVSVALVMDTSGSMRPRMEKAIQAVSAFFRGANPQDEFLLVEFNEHPKLVLGFTEETEPVARWIEQARPFGRTSLFDAIALALKQMKKAKYYRRALVILTDGGDNRSRLTLHEVKNLVLESDAQLYAMGIYMGKLATREEVNGPHLLDQLATATGGTHFRIDNLEDLPTASARIAYEMRNQYVLGYSPSNDTEDGKFRRVKVAFAPFAPEEESQRYRLHYRTGYYAPADGSDR
jgi:Ca-activated chloride channel family protein